MNRQSTKTNKSILFALTVSAILSVANAGEITSNFDASLEGWGITSDGDLTHIPAGGNPGGFAQLTDTGGANYAAFAPAKFLGDLSSFNGGTLSFDVLRVSGCCNPDPDFGRVTLSGSAGSVTLDFVPGAPGYSWTTYDAPMTAQAWGLSEATWQSLLADVQSIRIALEAYGGSDDTGLDNVTLFAEDIDSDGDGILDDEDNCPNSDLSSTISIGDCDSGVGNRLYDNGCTLADLVNQLVDECADGAKNHGHFVRCVSQGLNSMKKGGLISGAEKGALTSCAASQ